MIKLENHIRKIISLCKALSVRKSDLIDSAARDDFKENSDIDVLVAFDRDSNLFDRYFELKENLEKIFGRSVDIVMEEAIRIRFSEKVSIRTGCCFMLHKDSFFILSVFDIGTLID